jgi:hypothetical protein
MYYSTAFFALRQLHKFSAKRNATVCVLFTSLSIPTEHKCSSSPQTYTLAQYNSPPSNRCLHTIWYIYLSIYLYFINIDLAFSCPVLREEFAVDSSASRQNTVTAALTGWHLLVCQ